MYFIWGGGVWGSGVPFPAGNTPAQRKTPLKPPPPQNPPVFKIFFQGGGLSRISDLR